MRRPAKPRPLPPGFRIARDWSWRRIDHATVVGGNPHRLLRLSATGVAALDRLADQPVADATDGTLARRLVDAGLAHPVPPPPSMPPDVTIVIPVHDRVTGLDRCLEAVGTRYPVVVVDDGSVDHDGIAKVAAERGARLVRLPANVGPAGARNAGLAEVTSDLVAFLDSDCVPAGDWIAALAAHFADPLVAAVAPRIRTVAGIGSAERYARARGCLDLGDRPGGVAPGARIGYVPTAALLARRSGLLDAARRGEVFDPALRYGEDVDLVWRLVAAGQRVRYDPSVVVDHEDPDRWPALLARRFRYGTSAGELARRHPGATAPLRLPAWAAGAVTASLAGAPVVAGAGLALGAAAVRRRNRRVGIPAPGVGRLVAGAAAAWVGAGRYATQVGWPLLALRLAIPGRSARGRRQRAAAWTLLCAPAVASWATARPRLGPVTGLMGSIADDVAYGSGVWAGALRCRTAEPVRPVIGR